MTCKIATNCNKLLHFGQNHLKSGIYNGNHILKGDIGDGGGINLRIIAESAFSVLFP